MSVFSARPALRWLVPVVAAVAVVGGGAALGQFAAIAEPALPERTAAQLLVDLQTARLDGLSGTVVQRAELGLPELPAVAGQLGGGLASLVSGSNTLRVWYDGPEKARVALLSTLGETDLIRNGRDVWIWQSQTNTAQHHVLSPEDARDADRQLADPSLSLAPTSPQEAAELALDAVEPSTEVTIGRNAQVAGRDAYELVLAPKDKASLVGQVRLAIDAKEHLPLRVEIFAKGADEPAFEVAFTQISFETPGAERFRFNPPPNVKITEEDATERKVPGKPAPGKAVPPADERAAHVDDSAVVGEGWTAVYVTRLGDGLGELAKAEKDGEKVPGLAMLDQLKRVDGTWGSGRVLAGALFSALLTDDGRLLVGLVSPEKLYEVAGSPAAKVK